MTPSGPGPNKIENDKRGIYMKRNGKARAGGRDGGTDRGRADAIRGHKPMDNRETARNVPT
jgi:hypothetical protein